MLKMILNRLQIISQNYVVWNNHDTIGICGHFFVANYITKLRGLKQLSPGRKLSKFCGCKLYHKTTWFETFFSVGLFRPRFFSCKLYHKTTWFETRFFQSHSGEYIRCKLYHKTTWFETRDKNASKAYDKVANYITKLRGLKP